MPGGEYDRASGTSMAAPQVAGALALLRQQAPAAGVDQLLRRLTEVAPQISDTRPGGMVHGLPLLDLGALVALSLEGGATAAVKAASRMSNATAGRRHSGRTGSRPADEGLGAHPVAAQ